MVGYHGMNISPVKLNQLLGEYFQKNSLSKSKLIINPIYTLYHLGIDVYLLLRRAPKGGTGYLRVEDASHF